jgi:hypothetical protein
MSTLTQAQSTRGASEAHPARKTRLPANGRPRKGLVESLSTEFDFKGFHYCQIARKGMVAIYRQTGKGLEDSSVAYEVIKIQSHPETEMFRRLVPAHQSMPGSETWGKRGWTFTSKEKAFKKFEELTLAPTSIRRNFRPAKRKRPSRPCT